MTANLRFISHSPKADPHKLATERIGDRLTQAGFAYAGRPETTEDRAVSLRIEFPHCQIFDQPFLDFFEIVMVAIQHLLRLIEIEIVLAQFIPWKIRNDRDVTHDH